MTFQAVKKYCRSKVIVCELCLICLVFTGSVCHGDCTHWPVLPHERLPLPVPCVPVCHWPVWIDLSGAIPQLLLPRLYQGQAVAKGCAKRECPA